MTSYGMVHRRADAFCTKHDLADTCHRALGGLCSLTHPCWLHLVPHTACRRRGCCRPLMLTEARWTHTCPCHPPRRLVQMLHLPRLPQSMAAALGRQTTRRRRSSEPSMQTRSLSSELKVRRSCWSKGM